MPKKTSILVVDDDEGMLETITTILQEKGYPTETVKTGEKAITKAKERFFDIALIDINLPDIPSVELLRTFRKNHPTMMNIMITEHEALQNAVDALNIGANAYIMKPINPKRLDQVIKECLTYGRALLL
jgi:DNA-binding NtrC family response regulator